MKVFQLIIKMEEKHSGAPEGSLTSVGGTEILCFYFLYGVKAYKSRLRERKN